MTWPENITFPDEVWKTETGEPIDVTCKQISGTNTFHRKYRHVTVKLDCDTWEASITPSDPQHTIVSL